MQRAKSCRTIAYKERRGTNCPQSIARLIALPRLWNSLPASIRDCRNKLEIKRKLTRHLVRIFAATGMIPIKSEINMGRLFLNTLRKLDIVLLSHCHGRDESKGWFTINRKRESERKRKRFFDSKLDDKSFSVG
ncbi:hypothetical protein ANN_20379 [Periplaneta americana]|uniref:Uncharacterized protein n=1 Tax=Periplaneta americana TaxID=6978 RepID=A0ABQ8SCK5_PERAM|nr:hypothetical protein ANN_20379 [Periplaneta americana]